MLKITIVVEDESIEYLGRAETFSFEMADAEIGRLERNYKNRVALELKEELPL